MKKLALLIFVVFGNILSGSEFCRCFNEKTSVFQRNVDSTEKQCKKWGVNQSTPEGQVGPFSGGTYKAENCNLVSAGDKCEYYAEGTLKTGIIFEKYKGYIHCGPPDGQSCQYNFKEKNTQGVTRNGYCLPLKKDSDVAKSY